MIGFKRVIRSPLAICITGILALLIAGAWLRLGNMSPYLVYSDSYQPIIAAQHIASSHNVVASLGDGGMSYPPHLGWTRPMLPLAIAGAAATSGHSALDVAPWVSLAAGLGSIVLAFFMATTVFRSKVAGLAAALLLSISYASVVWGGFVLTEPLGIFLQLLVIVCLAQSLRGVSAGWGIALGASAVMLIAARYEYSVLLIPLMGLLVAQWWHAPKRFISIAGGGLAAAAGIASLTGIPVVGSLGDEIHDPLLIVGGLALIAVAGTIGFFFVRIRIPRAVYIWSSICIATATCLFIALHFSGALNFAPHDFLLVTLAIVGGGLLLRQKLPRATIAAWIVAAILLTSLYYLINPAMERYGTHLVPLLLIPASYACLQLWRRKQILFAVTFVLVVAAQVTITAQGLHAPNDVWFTRGYEQVAAERAAPLIQHSQLVVAAMPEPYWLYGAQPTTSVTPYSPYVFTGKLAPSARVTVISDEGMAYYFPDLNKRLQQRLAAFKSAEFTVSEPFRAVTTVTRAPQAVIIYSLTVEQLQNLLY